MFHFVLQFFIFSEVGNALQCHRKECTDVPSCRESWDICSGAFCYILRLQNVTNSQHFLLRRGCFSDTSPQIRYSAELEPYKALNECHRIIWKDIEYLVKICADRDYCNVCETWTERTPVKSGSGTANGYQRPIIGVTIFSLIIFLTFYSFI